MRNVLTRQALRWTPVIAVVLACGCARDGRFLQRLRQAIPIGHTSEVCGDMACASCPTSACVEGYDTCPDAPVVTGTRLGIRPGETAVQRSLLLQSRLSVAEEQNEVLATRIEELESGLRDQGQRSPGTTPEVRPVRFLEQAQAIPSSDAAGHEVARVTGDVAAQREILRPRRGGESVQLAAHTAPVPVSGPVVSQGPAVSGSWLGILPGSTATERLMETAAKLRAVEQEKRTLETELCDLQSLARQQQEQLARSTDEVRASRQELSQLRTLLERWKNDMEALRQKARDAEQENSETLHAVVALLQELLGEDVPRTPDLQRPKQK